MKSAVRRVSALVIPCLLILLPLAAAAVQTPSGLIKEMLGRVKSEKNYAVMLDYVHWPTVYANLKNQPEAKEHFKSPEELKQYFTNAIEDPEKMIREEMEKRALWIK